MSIGYNIRNIRKEKKMTLQQIADVMGCSPQLISQYENGKRKPKIEQIRKISAILGVYICDLVDDWSMFSKEEIAEDWKNSGSRNISHREEIEMGGHPLKVSEKPLLDNYRTLNETGQQKAADYVEDLTKIPEYQKKD